ncbi:hypothetical protein CEUSTIGMA_g5626.t1 [Chlamydomonas eustigma]|uniref:Uncharacterized protein n=1 Tax=Chlamydomonas eustigma TaxID=1157962 RepID=A0A250X521_9CHLO|nr:hypothetical protein CEUSTIGMA_g5626.t1 [Chlamydomonas eustigma]|eukprot:GAX78184.1 hypothetical protein CEUSTIGMA_g5626.t1 [Chlamydomonas eustigma]
MYSTWRVSVQKTQPNFSSSLLKQTKPSLVILRCCDVNSVDVASASSIRRIMDSSGARRVVIRSPDPRTIINTVSEKQESFDFKVDSIEVFACLMNAVKDGGEPPKLWKPIRRALARSLLDQECSSNTEQLRQEILEKIDVPGYVSVSEHDQYREEKCKILTADALKWISTTRRRPTWRYLQPLLRTVFEADPAIIPSVNRNGAAAEAWACQQILESTAAVAPGWQVVTSAVRMDVQSIKGVKGEADGLLIDEQGVCQGVVEVKIGGSNPYGALFSDTKKLRKLLDGVRGRQAVFATKYQESMGDEDTGLKEMVIPFSKSVSPVYLVVGDEDKPIEGQEVIELAVNSLVKVSLSMIMGLPHRWKSKGGLYLIESDSIRSKVRVSAEVIKAKRNKVVQDFFQELGGFELYQVPTISRKYI